MDRHGVVNDRDEVAKGGESETGRELEFLLSGKEGVSALDRSEAVRLHGAGTIQGKGDFGDGGSGDFRAD
jgi:hypothetical protein